MDSSFPVGKQSKNISPPKHIAIILDGNGRWAKRRALPRSAGHRRGVDAVRRTVEGAVERGICYLTLFAFSSENWRRPDQEVTLLKRLFYILLKREIKRIHAQGIRLKLIGDIEPFGNEIVEASCRAELLTASNNKMVLTIALNYGGRWDIVQAVKRLVKKALSDGRVPEIDERVFASQLSLGTLPDPDLIIRTGGEKRLSNFLLWHSAYSEFYFTNVCWPDFDITVLDQALFYFASRNRQYGGIKNGKESFCFNSDIGSMIDF